MTTRNPTQLTEFAKYNVKTKNNWSEIVPAWDVALAFHILLFLVGLKGTHLANDKAMGVWSSTSFCQWQNNNRTEAEGYIFAKGQ